MTNKELHVKVTELEKRIAELESMLKTQDIKTSRTNTVESKDSKTKTKKAPTVVGNLIFDGKHVKTGTGFMSSKTRYAIGMAITEKFGGTKLAKGNPVYDKCRKADKYVQVYEFKTVADCKKFMEEQQKRVG